jgi:hypothetical protein
MAKKAGNGEVNKSAAIRQLLEQNPALKASEVIATLADRGIDVAPSLFYFTKGRLRGRKGGRRKMRQKAEKAAGATANGDALSTIKKVKGLASEVGGLKKLMALVQALRE